MLDIKDGDLIITPNHIKKYIMKNISKRKAIINCKYMNLNELKERLFETYDEKSLYYMMKKYNLKYSIAKEYLNNIHLDIKENKKYNLKYSIAKEYLNNIHLDIKENKKYKEQLKNLLIKKTLPNYKRIIIVGYHNIDPYILKKINNAEIIEEKIEEVTKKVYEFSTQTDEIVYVSEMIAEDLKKVDINDMYLVVPNSEYTSELERIFTMMNIPLDYKKNYKIYSTATAQIFLNKLKETRNIKKSLESIKQNEIYNQIIDILNKYTFIKEIDDYYIEIIENELQDKKIKQNKRENSVKVINYDEIYDKEKYYYILGFNQNIIPRLYSDNEIIKDKEKEKLGILTSNQKNKNEKELVTKIINYPHTYISYKLNDNYQSYYPSSLISDLNLEIIKNPKPNYKYSNSYNKLLLSSLLDNYINYNEKDERLYDLYPNYENIEYKTYDNSFKNINQEKLKEYLKDKLSLSYSSMNNYFLCPFKYYIENILKLNPFEETFAIKVGNLFHTILQNMYTRSDNVDILFTDLSSKMELNPSELFFVKKLYEILKEDIKVIKMQDSLSKFDNRLTERKITVEYNKKIKIKFTGIVDKISYLDNYMIITDYKTGSADATLENIDDGLHLQLPVYIYLIKNEFKESEIVGFYLQKLIHSKQLDKEEKIIDNLKLNGYTINDEKIINNIDNTYEDSKMIKGMKKSKTGFYSYTKLVTKEEIDKIYEITKANIEKVIKAVEKGEFKINPKRINNEIISCKYCKYKDLCFYKEEDITNLKKKTLKEIVGDIDA